MDKVISSNHQYPLIDQSQMETLELEARNLGFLRVLFPLARTYEGKWYADIYIYINSEKRFRRIVIEPDKKITASEISELWGSEYFYTRSSERENEHFYNGIFQVAPELNLKKYDNVRDALCHIYYASHREDLREQLYKSGLDVIARNYVYINDLDDNATNIEEAFKLPLSLIRKMNSHFGLYTGLIDREARDLADRIYKSFHGMLNDIYQIEYFQWAYLHDCLYEHKTPDKAIFRKLSQLEVYYNESELDGEELYEVYVPYKQNRRIAKQKYDISFPRKVNCFSRPVIMYSICDLAKEFAENGDEIDHSIRSLEKKMKERFCYDNGDLFIRPPFSAKELMSEWKNQNNCLHFYIIPMTEGKTFILFLRKNEFPDKSYVTVEIRDDQLKQAYMRNDAPVGEKEKAFLREFCNRAQIEFCI